MDRPTLVQLTSEQNEAKAVLKTIADFVITSALDASYLNVPEDEAYKYGISTAPLTDKDVAKLSTMLTQVSTALTVAQGQGWIDEKKAAQMFAFCTSMLGFEYDPDDNEDLPPEGTDYKNGKTAPETPTVDKGGTAPASNENKGL